MVDFSDFLDALNPEEFDETPVDLDTFLYDKHYMGVYMEGVKLSPIQYEIVERGSIIYKLETLEKVWGPTKAKELHKKNVKNLLLMLGKGSGKDFVTRLMVLYIVHQLLCLKDPARYYGKPSGDPIDIVNMAINAPQARTVFFEPLVEAVKKSDWFADKMYEPRMTDIRFHKKITVYSMHSSFEAAEGKNLLVGVLDEIDGFTVEGQAAGLYKAISGTLSSRFPQYGKMIALSFPRSKSGWIMSKYNEIVDEVEVEEFEHEYILNEALPHDDPNNILTVRWTEDTIISYKRDNWFALKAPTFRVNPGRTIEDYKDDFETDRQNNDSDTLMRVCANPPDHDATTFFQNHEKIEQTFSAPNGWVNDELKCHAEPEAEYFVHVDLSKVSDRCVVAMGHVSNWVEPSAIARLHSDAQPFIIIDLFRVWEPSKTKPVDDGEVMDFILLLAKKFNVRLVTFDRWRSFDMIEHLNSVGIDADRNSLVREDYIEFRTVMNEGRLQAPYDERVHKELKNLILDKGKVVEPAGKEHFNDISEACCGVVVGCIENTSRNTDLEVIDLESVDRAEVDMDDPFGTLTEKPPMPGDLAAFLDNWKAI